MTRFQPLMGQENEVAFTALNSTGAPLLRGPNVQKLVLQAASTLPHIMGGSPTDFYLGNGGRLYIDAGEHPEWATPECLSPFDVVTWRAAGEEILARAATALENSSTEVDEVLLARISGDYTTGATRGGHESYLVRRSLDVHAREIVPHLVSRLIFTGAGGFDNTNAGARFMVSPRVAHLKTVISGGSTAKRGIFHTREEPLCSGNYHRMHVLCGENLMSHTADVLRMGTTTLIAFVIDAGARPATNVSLADPVHAMQTFAFDPNCTATVPLVGGGTTRAIDIQRHYLRMVEHFREAPDFPAWGIEVCAMWREVLTMLEENPESLDSVLDWRIKFGIFRSTVQRSGSFSWDTFDAVSRHLVRRSRRMIDDVLALHLVRDIRAVFSNMNGLVEAVTEFWQLRDQLCELDVKFCRVGKRSLFARLDGAGLLRHRLVSSEAIEKAITVPPKGRASVRGAIIDEIFASPRTRGNYRADWMNIYDFSQKRRIDLTDPYQSTRGGWKLMGRAPRIAEQLVF